MPIGIFLLLFWPQAAGARNVDTSDASEFVDGDRPLLRLNYDNDYFAGTDRFYTEGIGVDYYDPVLRRSPLMRSLFALPGGSRSYGLVLRQSVFTPTHLDSPRILHRDRPYAAYLFFGHVLVSKDADTGLVLTTELDTGMIGPAAGGYAQAWVHRNIVHGVPPQGWENQIRNDVVLDYYARIEKTVQAAKYEDFSLDADATAGTLYDNSSIGDTLRIGFINPARAGHFFFFGGAEAKAVAYDATLQGGMTNHRSPYVLQTHQIKRLVPRETIGAAASWRDWTIEFERVFLTPEFEDDLNQQWGEVTIMKQF